MIRAYLEPRLEAIFSEHSYGYRPLKSAHDAVKTVRENIKHYGWVIDIDIKSFFDEVSHELLMKALDCHVEEKWVKMYISRWLEAPSESSDGVLTYKNGSGTPQGGVISPLLANLFLHYVLDKWLTIHHSDVAFVRYADDVIVHCQSEEQAKQVLESIAKRLLECKLRLSESKTKIVYCQNYQRKQRKDYPKKFDFLGFTYKPEMIPSNRGGMFLGTTCVISQKSQSRIVAGWKELKLHRRAEMSIQEIANKINPQMRGIIQYYGKINKHGLNSLMRHFRIRLCKWVLNKYKGKSFKQGYRWIDSIKRSYPNLFYHWQIFPHV